MLNRAIIIKGEHFGDVSETMRVHLAESLFEQKSSLIIGSVCIVALAVYCWLFTREMWLLVFAATSFVIMTGRVGLGVFYDRESRRKDPMVWTERFIIGAGLNSVALGVAASAAVFSSTFLVQMVMICALVSYATAAAVRNHAVPIVAFVQLIPPFVLTALACVLTFDPFHIGYSIFIIINLLACLEIASFLRKKTAKLIETEERVFRANADLAKANTALEALAITDGLTGVMNRRGFDMALENAWQRAIREERPISLLLLDLDHFKLLNDTLGHANGDDCLRRIGASLKAMLRPPGAIVARYGGEEFAVVLPDTRYHDAERIADAVRRAIRALRIPHPKNQAGTMSASLGFVTMSADRKIMAAALLKLADDALYEAKQSGRDGIRGRCEADLVDQTVCRCHAATEINPDLAS